MQSSYFLARDGARRSLAFLVAAALTVVVVPVPAQATPPFAAGAAVPGDAVASATACPTEAPDEATASVHAQRCGRSVEVLDARTEFDTVHALPDGTMRLEVSNVAVRTRVHGPWQDVDTTVVPAKGRVEVVAPAVAMSFSDGSAGEPLARIVRDGHELTMDVPFELTEPVLTGSTVTYPAVLPGVDLLVTVHEDGTGFSEVLRIADPQAAANPELAELTLPITTSDGLQVQDSQSGTFEAVTADGEVVFDSPTALMWDSSADEAVLGVGPAGADPLTQLLAASQEAVALAQNYVERQDAPVTGDEVAALDVQVDSDALTVVPDESLLTDPATVWPVYVDPPVSGFRQEWTAVRDTRAADYKFTHYNGQGVGYCNTADPYGSSCGSPAFKSRLMWEFTNLTALPALSSANIISAEFAATGYHAYSCTPSTVQLYRVDDFGQSTQWPGGTAWNDPSRLVTAQTITHRTGCTSGNTPRRIEFDVKPIAQWAAEANSTSVWIGLKAQNEAKMDGWKRYLHDATLSIDFNRAPNTPTDLRIVNDFASQACSGSTAQAPLAIGRAHDLKLTAFLSDPDGGLLRGNINIYNPAGDLIWDPPMTDRQVSGQTHSVTVPLESGVPALAEGVTYYWDVNSTDDVVVDSKLLWSPKSARCYFRIDRDDPAKPTITAPTAALVVGTPARFEIRTTSPDVAGYKYSVNGTGGGRYVAAAATNPTELTITPEHSGGFLLYVEAVDRAGNTSAHAQTDTRNIYIPAVGEWPLDEGSGLKALNSASGGTTHDLVLSSSTPWSDGVFAGEGDSALSFGSAARSAATTGPVIVDTTKSFTVQAVVKLDTLPTGSATAVSQDGVNVSGFDLGYRGAEWCAGKAAGCWTFFRFPSDAGGSSPVAAQSSATVTAGQWTVLTGVYDASAARLRLYVGECASTPTVSLSGPAGPGWKAAGAFRLGSAKSGSTTARYFPGHVAAVRAFPFVVSDTDPVMTQACSESVSTQPQ